MHIYGNESDLFKGFSCVSYLFSLETFSQVTIYSHDFDDIVGFSSDETFCNATSCSSSDNKYGTQTNPSCVKGFTGTTFMLVILIHVEVMALKY